jgi:hypothetical protein
MSNRQSLKSVFDDVPSAKVVVDDKLQQYDEDGEELLVDEKATVKRMHYTYAVIYFIHYVLMFVILFLAIFWIGAAMIYGIASPEQLLIKAARSNTLPPTTTPPITADGNPLFQFPNGVANNLPMQSNNFISTLAIVRVGKIVV